MTNYTDTDLVVRKIPEGQLLAHGWLLANEYTKDLFPGAVFMRQIGGSATPFASYDFAIVQSDSEAWIPVHGCVKMPPVTSPEEAAYGLMKYWHDLPDEGKLRANFIERKLEETKGLSRSDAMSKFKELIWLQSNR